MRSHRRGTAGKNYILSAISEHQLDNIFANICIALRIFLCIAATVATGERSFSKLKLIIKSVGGTQWHRTTSMIWQDRAMSIECKLALKTNFDDVVKTFAATKARKAFINKWKRQFLHCEFLFLTEWREGAQKCLVPSTFNPLGGPAITQCYLSPDTSDHTPH